MKIGLVDLDTSHPEAWLPIERELGHEVIGVCDGGSVHPEGYAAQFAARHGIPNVFPSPEAMAAEVDCAILHGCDWDAHVSKARPFVEAGKAVLIDKPLAGNRADLRQIEAWVKQGARIAGGSALRFCAELRKWLARPVEERGEPHTVFCGCGVDEFNYGIHAFSLASGVFGGGLQTARALEGGPQRRVELRWPGGRTALVMAGQAAAWLPFYLTVVTEKTVFQCQPEPGALYRALLEATLPYLAGERAEVPVPPGEWIEPELAALAARESSIHGGREVALHEVPEGQGYDGAEFARGYREAKYG